MFNECSEIGFLGLALLKSDLPLFGSVTSKGRERSGVI